MCEQLVFAARLALRQVGSKALVQRGSYASKAPAATRFLYANRYPLRWKPL
jgi:hypothetical protein